MKIKTLTLNNFRAFPGPGATCFDLGGKNLLVYGENGSGKSSIFTALREFFSLAPSQPLEEHKNIFAPENPVEVKVEFTGDKLPAVWTPQRHPGSPPGDKRVIQTALLCSCLDYQALLDTNYKHGTDPINLFDVAVTHLVADFLVSSGSQFRTIDELWLDLKQKQPTKNKYERPPMEAARLEFNLRLQEALDALTPKVNELLIELKQPDLVVNEFPFSGITYNNERLWKDRKFEGREILIDLSYRNLSQDKPHLFLNEARLSALALAMYLAGRLTCLPTYERSQDGVPPLRLLVLDDVLIGLDHSNRHPLLDLLRNRFNDWQIVLLTFDRVWFEMTRLYMESSNEWNYIEIFEGICPARGIPAPTVRKANKKAAEDCLDQAEDFLKNHHVPAAANYARTAFELALKVFCHRFSVPVPFSLEANKVSSEDLLSSVEIWLGEHKKHKNFAGILEQVKLYRKVVLNPYSHAAPPTIVTSEVEGAIRAVRELLKLHPLPTEVSYASLSLARQAIAPVPKLDVALDHLCGAFRTSLTAFCKREVNFPLGAAPSIGELWKGALAQEKKKEKEKNLITGPNGIEAGKLGFIKTWLVEEVSEETKKDLSEAVILELLRLISRNDDTLTILDTL